MKNFKQLSRNDLKNVVGGRACTLSIQQPNGTWVTHEGTCNFRSTGTNNGVTYNGYHYCNIGDGINHALTSNGGLSRCNE